MGVSAGRVLAASYTVTISDTKFVPASLKVKPGDTITFINTTTATQSAKTTSSSGFNTGNIGPNASKSVTVSTAGIYSYTSAFNTALQGTVTVEGTATTTSTPSATTTTTTTKGAQPLPVSGTAEVLMALIAGGLGLIAFGTFTEKFGTVSISRAQPVVEIPPVSPYNDSGDDE
jgi:plastocyanin